MLHAEREHHLALPEGDGIDERGLDLFDHQRVVVLEKSRLWAHLERHHARELQVMQLLFKALALLRVVVVGLRILGKAAGLCLLAQLLELAGADLGQTLFARDDIHGQLFVVLEVQLIHLVEHRDVLHQRDLMLFKLRNNAVHARLGLAVLRAHQLELILLLVEKAREALLLLLTEALDLDDEVRKRLAHLAKILVAHGGEGIFRERRNALLRGHAVVEHKVRIRDVDLFRKIVDGFLLLLGEHALIDLDGLDFLFLRLGRRGRFGRECQLRDGFLRRFGGVQGQLGHHVVTHIIFPPYSGFPPVPFRIF